MIERDGRNREEFPDLVPSAPTRVERSGTLKKKINVIIKEYPNKTLSVLRRWLNDDHN